MLNSLFLILFALVVVWIVWSLGWSFDIKDEAKVPPVDKLEPPPSKIQIIDSVEIPTRHAKTKRGKKKPIF